MKFYPSILLLSFCIGLSGSSFGQVAADKTILESPNKKFKISVSSDEKGSIYYQAFFEGSVLIGKSYLGVETLKEEVLGLGYLIHADKAIQVARSWKPVYGERQEYPENYRELLLHLSPISDKGTSFDLRLRAYNEGLAFRYEFKAENKITIKREITEFRMEPKASAWVTAMSQGAIAKMPVSEIQTQVERPLLIENSEGLFIALGEAAQIDYPRMKFISSSEPGVLGVSLAGTASSLNPAHTPWRFIMAGKSAGQILENNYLVLNLNEPNAIEDPSWMKPGKVIREVSLSTQGGKACVDFAEKHHLEYIHFDAGWYGNEYSVESDASTVTLDPNRSKGPLDLHEVIKYAKERGVDVILYVNRNQLEKQLDEILPLYQKWGVKGMKYGFVRTGDQEWSSWLHEAVRKAADYEMVLSIHDDYRPVGYSRTYPNLMTVEGIRGDEESPSNAHTLKTMFTRMIAGAGDNTVCYFAPRVEKMGSHASQLAKSVCIYSPLLWLYWYDRPLASPGSTGGAGGSNPVISEVPELAFFDLLPTVWEETVVLHSEVGKLGTIARKSKNSWFIGTVNGKQKRTVRIPLDFLDVGRDYIAEVYFDDPNVATPTKVGVKTISVTAESILQETVEANNGLAIRIVPMEK